MTFNFGEVLTRAWQITWKYKVLWIFGILAGCTNGGGGGSGGGGNSGYSTGPSDQNLPPELQRFFYQMENFVDWVADNLWLFIAIMVLVFLVLMVISIFLGTIGRIGLIKGSYEAEQGAEKPGLWRVVQHQHALFLARVRALIPDRLGFFIAHYPNCFDRGLICRRGFLVPAAVDLPSYSGRNSSWHHHRTGKSRHRVGRFEHVRWSKTRLGNRQIQRWADHCHGVDPVWDFPGTGSYYRASYFHHCLPNHLCLCNGRRPIIHAALYCRGLLLPVYTGGLAVEWHFDDLHPVGMDTDLSAADANS